MVQVMSIDPQETSHIFFLYSSTPLLQTKQTLGDNLNEFFPMLIFFNYFNYFVNNSTKKLLQFYSFWLNLWLRILVFFSSSKFKLRQLLEDLKPSVFVFSGTCCLTAAAAATRIKSVTRMSQPDAVRTVRVFEAHHVTILQRGPIIGVL